MEQTKADSGQSAVRKSSIVRESTVVYPAFKREEGLAAPVARVFVRAAGNGYGLITKGMTDEAMYERTLKTGRVYMTPDEGEPRKYDLLCPVVSWKNDTLIYFVESDGKGLEPFDFAAIGGLFRYVVGGGYVVAAVARRNHLTKMRHASMRVQARLVGTKLWQLPP